MAQVAALDAIRRTHTTCECQQKSRSDDMEKFPVASRRLESNLPGELRIASATRQMLGGLRGTSVDDLGEINRSRHRLTVQLEDSNTRLRRQIIGRLLAALCKTAQRREIVTPKNSPHLSLGSGAIMIQMRPAKREPREDYSEGPETCQETERRPFWEAQMVPLYGNTREARSERGFANSERPRPRHTARYGTETGCRTIFTAEWRCSSRFIDLARRTVATTTWGKASSARNVEAQHELVTLLQPLGP